MKSPLTYHLETFDGPLDLLLHLISKNKVNIYDIPIAQILEQYMEQLRRMEEMDLEVTSDFVAMAAQLMYIKSKMLLPVYPEEGEEDPRKPLVEALLEYKKCKKASGLLEERMELGRDLYTKPPEVQKREEKPEYHYTAQVLQKAIETILQRRERRSPPPLRLFHGVVGESRFRWRGSCSFWPKDWLCNTAWILKVWCWSAAAVPRWWLCFWRCWNCPKPINWPLWSRKRDIF